MLKKDTNNYWIAHCWVSGLAAQCKNREKQSDNSADGGNDGAIELDALTAVLASKTALIDERLSFVGYLKIVFALFKITFCNKKPKGFRKVFKCFIE